MGEFVWKREQGEPVRAFEERIAQEVRSRPTPHWTQSIILLEKAHSGLPEPSVDMPAYTPYPEVLRRLKETQGAHNGLLP